ncbi:iron-containing alcohol dehydrogenase, partial [Salmonella enterica subsp. enterica serovar Istanbul]|nr:iron-containing alcohol dehydrogenase [Salmonella enterica subsp. enterica serovar Istanbul]
LEKSYHGDIAAKSKMHDASTIAGMAFANALLEINHSIAHKVGQAFIKLAHSVGIKLSLKDQGVKKADLDKQVDRLAELAYEDNCT